MTAPEWSGTTTAWPDRILVWPWGVLDVPTWNGHRWVWTTPVHDAIEAGYGGA